MKRSDRHGARAAGIVVALLFMSGFMHRCAHTMTPTGGPKDTIPPVIVRMTPDNFTTDFKDRKIYIEFDEFVQLKDQSKEFYTSPAMKSKPTLAIRGRGVSVTIKDTLLGNTTYALNFGSAIRDNNEGNPLHSMRFVFSTGGEIDSMICSGYTADAYKNDSVSKSFIYFYPVDSLYETEEFDSTFFARKPAAIARAEGNGIFIAQNLKPIDYRIYAFEDANGNMLYEPSVEKVGFIDTLCNPSRMPAFSIWFDSLRMYPSAEPQLYIRMFTDEKFNRQYLRQSERPLQHKALLYFGAAHPQIGRIRFDSIPDENVIVDPQTRGRDTIALWFHHPSQMLPDTIKGEITYFKHDSLNVLREVTEPLRLAWKHIETKEEAKERERLEREREEAEILGEEWTPPAKPNPFKVDIKTSGEVNPEQHIAAVFDYPLVRLDSAAVTFTSQQGSDTQPKAQPLTFRRDTSNMRKWYLETRWEQGMTYNLLIPAGAIEDAASQTNDTIRGSFTVMDPDKYATVSVNVKERGDGCKYILQLTNASGALQQEKRDVTGGRYEFKYVPAGEIKLRVVEDRNGNGRWDAGSVVERRQPERAEYYTNDNGEETFVTKVNWEVEVDMDMERVFAPVTMESLMRTLDERESQRIAKWLEEQAKKRKEEQNRSNGSNNRNSGSMMGGAMSGISGMTGGMGGGLRQNTLR